MHRTIGTSGANQVFDLEEKLDVTLQPLFRWGARI